MAKDAPWLNDPEQGGDAPWDRDPVWPDPVAEPTSVEQSSQNEEVPDVSHQFDTFMEDLQEAEGGYVNNPNDKGGETNFGISKRQYPDVDIANLTLEEAKQIYHKDYYKPIKGDQLPPKLGHAVFDYAVNSGVSKAVKDLQRLLGVTADGIIGPQTLEAIRDEDEDELLKKYLEKRKKNFERIIKRNPSQKVFKKGWMKRVSKLEDKYFPPETPEFAVEDGIYEDEEGNKFTVENGEVVSSVG